MTSGFDGSFALARFADFACALDDDALILDGRNRLEDAVGFAFHDQLLLLIQAGKHLAVFVKLFAKGGDQVLEIRNHSLKARSPGKRDSRSSLFGFRVRMLRMMRAVRGGDFRAFMGATLPRNLRFKFLRETNGARRTDAIGKLIDHHVLVNRG